MDRRRFLSCATATLALGASPVHASIRDLMCLPTVGGAGGSLASYAPGGLDPGDNGVAVPGLDPNAPRRIKIYNHRSNDRIDVEYFAGGAYVSSAVQEFSYFMRDWRNNEVKAVDPKLIDIIWRISEMLSLSGSFPLQINSGYRSPNSNAVVGGANNSMHMYAKAMDLSHPQRSPRQIQAAALRLSGGGVGIYQTFCHVDSGRVRTWRA